MNSNQQQQQQQRNQWLLNSEAATIFSKSKTRMMKICVILFSIVNNQYVRDFFVSQYDLDEKQFHAYYCNLVDLVNNWMANDKHPVTKKTLISSRQEFLLCSCFNLMCCPYPQLRK